MQGIHGHVRHPRTHGAHTLSCAIQIEVSREAYITPTEGLVLTQMDVCMRLKLTWNICHVKHGGGQ